MPAPRNPDEAERPAALVLAGGLSRRMGGGDKSLTILGDRPLLAHVLGRLATQTGRIAISANGDPARFIDFGRPVLADRIEGHLGPLAGLFTGMVWAVEIGSAELITAPTDSPFLPRDLVVRLTKASREHPRKPVLASSGGRRHPVVGLWPTALAGRLLDFLSSGTNYKVSDFADVCQAVATDFPMTKLADRTVDPFFNVNTPDDLSEAAAVWRQLRR